MKQVNFITKYEKWPFLRQTPEGGGHWGNASFSINDQSEKSFDWMVVYGDPPLNFSTVLPKERRILFIAEPPSIKQFSKKYLSQFGIIVTPFRLQNIPSGSIEYISQTGLPWHYGISRADITKHKTYDEMLVEKPCEKNMFCSSIISNKKITIEQKIRSKTLLKLQDEFSDFMLFGNGYCNVDNKAEGIDSYYFHIVAENNNLDNFWTEKLADAYLGWSLPLFFGASNLESYFPKDSFIEINLNDYSASRQLLLDLRKNTTDLYNQKLPQIIKARNMVLNKYNIFQLMNDVMEKYETSIDKNKKYSYVIQINPEPLYYRFRRTVKRLYNIFITQ